MTLPPRFAIARAAIDGDRARLTGPELHHLRDVARLRPGATVSLIDEDRREYRGAILEFNDDAALISVEALLSPTPARRIILAAALIKAPRMDFLVEKAAELGAPVLIPLRCARSLTQPSAERVTRWRRIALAAAKQSHAPLMEIRPAATVPTMLAELAGNSTRILCAPDGVPLSQLLTSATEPRYRAPDVSLSEASCRASEAILRSNATKDLAGKAEAKARPEPAEGDLREAINEPAENLSCSPDLLLAIGPEGDFTAAERAAMLAAGFVPASLGPYRLRSETAALAALSIAVATAPN